MPKVHPTAIVDDRASLGEGAVVGPWCHIDGEVAIGPNTRLLERVSLKGPLTLGADNVLYPNACVGFAPQDRKFDPEHDGAGVHIGDRNILREGVSIHRATADLPTSLGHDNYLMANSHVAHDCRVGSHTMFANGALIGGHVHVGDMVILGGNAVLHQFCRVGRLALLSGLSGAGQDIPPFCISYKPRRIGSLNLIGLRRAGLRQHLRPLKSAFRTFFRLQLPNTVALQRIRDEVGHDPLVAEFVDFIADSQRGITPYQSSTLQHPAPNP